MHRSDHFYPAADYLLYKDRGIMSSQNTKNYFVGELDWTGQVSDSPLVRALSCAC